VVEFPPDRSSQGKTSPCDFGHIGERSLFFHLFFEVDHSLLFKAIYYKSLIFCIITAMTLLAPPGLHPLVYYQNVKNMRKNHKMLDCTRRHDYCINRCRKGEKVCHYTNINVWIVGARTNEWPAWTIIRPCASRVKV
jgi:hypothetical protein